MSLIDGLNIMKILFSDIVLAMQSFHIFGTDLFTISIGFFAVSILIMFVKFALYQTHGNGKWII